MRKYSPDLFDSFERDFKNMKRSGNYFTGFVVCLIVATFAWNVYQYSMAPTCNNGALIQDDAGRIVCVPTDQAVFLRKR